MRCGTNVTLWGFTTATGATRVRLDTIQLGPEGATCTAAQYVVMTEQEFSQNVASPFRLTLAEGGAIGGAILGVWAIAWAIRQLVKVLVHTDTPPPHDS